MKTYVIVAALALAYLALSALQAISSVLAKIAVV